MSIEVIVPEENKKSYESMRFAPAVHHDGLIFCSGIIGKGDSAEDEFRNAWQEVGRLLEYAGVDFADVIDTTLYIVDLQKNAPAMFAVKNEFVKEPYPASTWIGITELIITGARAEIKVTARKRS